MRLITAHREPKRTQRTATPNDVPAAWINYERREICGAGNTPSPKNGAVPVIQSSAEVDTSAKDGAIGTDCRTTVQVFTIGVRPSWRTVRVHSMESIKVADEHGTVTSNSDV
jgi:hypothetical protein